MEKEVAIGILKDIENSLMSSNWKQSSLKTIELYRKGLEIATNEKIKKMIDRHCGCVKKYGKSHFKTRKLEKKIDGMIQTIYNKKIEYI